MKTKIKVYIALYTASILIMCCAGCRSNGQDAGDLIKFSKKPVGAKIEFAY